MPLYTLLLSSGVTSTHNKEYLPISQMPGDTTYTNLNAPGYGYIINFDELFNGNNYNEKYKKCFVKVRFMSQAFSQAASWANTLGYLSMRFENSRSFCTSNGTPTLLYNGILSPTGEALTCYMINTMDSQKGVQIDVPKGSQKIYISLILSNRFNTPSVITVIQNLNPTFLISFELST